MRNAVKLSFISLLYASAFLLMGGVVHTIVNKAQLPSTTVYTDQTNTYSADQALGNNRVTGIKELRFQGQSGSPASFAVGGNSYDTTQKAFIEDTDAGVQGRSGVIFVQKSEATTGGTLNTGDTVASSAAENNFATNFTFPANSITAGKIIHYRAWFRESTTGTPTLDIRIKLGSTAICDTGTTLMDNNSSNKAFAVAGDIICRTIGLSGNFVGFMLSGEQYNSASFGFTRSNATNINPAISFNTTGSLIFQVSAQWSASSSSNTVTMEGLIVEVEN